MKISNYFQSQAVSQMWNSLDPNPLRGLVSDDITYESSWVLLPIVGKKKFLSYITKKINTISKSVSKGEMTIHSEVVRQEGSEGLYFIVLTHQITLNEIKSLITVSVNEDGLINRISIDPFYPESPVKTMKILWIDYPRMRGPDSKVESSETKHKSNQV